ncbi:MAG: LemA family protein [Bacteroidales bacterium]|jgi:LemA protein|nr:LemA family protein [Bacteroidales bacterium]HOL98392.1 LemA family protein [Bacteroidales bacterium]HOM37399.1 LemA family protein [Bacteroidales bacterium]HPD24836.1 LemA family protein [Bacteroidales bacterium]HRS99562.1 LemA family protein [Bacteroidales bacterium]
MKNEPQVKGKGCLAFTIFGLPLLIGLIIFVLWAGFYAFRTYNKCVERNEAVKNAWSNVENAYQKRLDLIPNIVATVKGYAEHEQETFIAVTEARSKASSINLTVEDLTEENLAKFEAAQEELNSAISRLLVTVENYPELKANQNFIDLQNELKVIEAEIISRRDLFNNTVKDYNVFVLKFPRNIFAKMFGFREKSYFKAKPGAENAPEVKF